MGSTIKSVTFAAMHAGCSFHEMQAHVNAAGFEATALAVFRYQAENNPVYRRWLALRNLSPDRIQSFDEIPFLPIETFRNHYVSCFPDAIHEQVFLSSTTTKQKPSKHFVYRLDVYKASVLEGFRLRFGPPDEWQFIALLPSYLERGQSSLVWMVHELMKASGQSDLMFYKDVKVFQHELERRLNPDKKTMLFGVTYALLDWSEANRSSWPMIYIVETGGMKGRRKEISREELHTILYKTISPKHVLSEYGMTEMLSQAWLNDTGSFETPPWLRIQFSDTDDLFQVNDNKGCIRFADLANLHSCSFVQTPDLGERTDEKGFRVIGRLDTSELRGCNLMWN